MLEEKLVSITTHVDISASTADIWKVLTDFAAYADWNPFVVSAEGALVPGSRLTIRIQLPGSSAMTIRPVLTRFDGEQEFEWQGKLIHSALFQGMHGFRLEPRGDGVTRFHHYEHFRGILVPMVMRRIQTKTRAGFEAMNAALKQRAESGVASTAQDMAG